MKKLTAILLLFVASLFIAHGQSKVTYVDSLKSVTVSVTSDSKKQLSVMDNLQSQLVRVVDNQNVVNTEIAGFLKTLTQEVPAYIKEIEKRNKSDGLLISDKFNYSPERVKQVMKIERWLNFTTYFLFTIYFLWATYKLNQRLLMEHLLARFLIYTAYGVAGFMLTKWLLTLIFNGDYYVIKELITLYT